MLVILLLSELSVLSLGVGGGSFKDGMIVSIDLLLLEVTSLLVCFVSVTFFIVVVDGVASCFDLSGDIDDGDFTFPPPPPKRDNRCSRSCCGDSGVFCDDDDDDEEPVPRGCPPPSTPRGEFPDGDEMRGSLLMIKCSC